MPFSKWGSSIAYSLPWRDDLPDGGAKVWAATIRAVRHRNPNTAIEVLVPDFQGNFDNLDIVLDSNPIFSTITWKP